jgi:methionine-rich copper-binding protein CopC
VSIRLSAAFAIALTATLALWSQDRAQAHAIIVDSVPSVGTEVLGPDVAVSLHYNNRIDKARSRLTLLVGEQAILKLPIDGGGTPDVITAKATGLAPGAYRLRWQVLALDGHITRGEIPFTVTAP